MQSHEILDDYLECAVWASTDWSKVDLDDTPLDEQGYSVDDLTDKALERAGQTCTDFLNLVQEYDEANGTDLLAGWTPEQVGHDLWLTRNGHGTGFWDRGKGEAGKALSDIAKTFGPAYVWIDSSEPRQLSIDY